MHGIKARKLVGLPEANPYYWFTAWLMNADARARSLAKTFFVSGPHCK
jgi:hypothetical protein